MIKTSPCISYGDGEMAGPKLKQAACFYVTGIMSIVVQIEETLKLVDFIFVILLYIEIDFTDFVYLFLDRHTLFFCSTSYT
jgi:hypothetical protein